MGERPSSPVPWRAASARWVRYLATTDPGNLRLRFMVGLLVSGTASVLAAGAFAIGTDQLVVTVPDPDAADGVTTAVSHSTAMVIGGMSALVLVLAPLPPTPGRRLAAMAICPPMLILGSLIGVLVGGSTLVAVVTLCMLATLAVLLKGNPLLQPLGTPILFGTFLAVFVHLGVEQIPWVAAIVALSATVGIAMHFAVSYPSPMRTVERIRRSFDRGQRRVLVSVIDLLEDAPGAIDPAIAAVRDLNRAGLVLDGHLAQTYARLAPRAIDQLHHEVFDREASCVALVRAAVQVVRAGSSRHRPAIVEALGALGSEDLARARARADEVIGAARTEIDQATDDEARQVARANYRMAVAVLELATLSVGTQADDGLVIPTYRPEVSLVGGQLTGSGAASALVHGPEPTDGRSAAIPLDLRHRAVRMLAATGLAVSLGYLVSAEKWYWAFFTALAVMSAANTAAEHIRTGVERALGTSIGVVVGVVVAHAVGGISVLSLAVLVLAVGVAFYFQRLSNLVSACAFTVMVSQLYLQLGRYTDGVLVIREVETAVGAFAAIGVALLVFRVRTSDVTRVAIVLHLTALDETVRNTVAHIVGARRSTELRSDVRHLQDAQHQLNETAGPAAQLRRRDPHDATQRQIALLGALTHDAANLARRATTAEPFADEHRARLTEVGANLSATIAAVAAAFEGAGASEAGRGARDPLPGPVELDRIDLAVRRDPSVGARRQLAVLREISVLDQHLLELAATVGLTIVGLTAVPGDADDPTGIDPVGDGPAVDAPHPTEPPPAAPAPSAAPGPPIPEGRS